MFDYYFISNVVNLLTNIPSTCLDQLFVKNHLCGDIDALKVIIDFLDSRLSSTEVSHIIISVVLYNIVFAIVILESSI